MTVRPVNLDGGTDGEIGQIGQVIGEEAFFDPVDAELKAVAIGGRGDGVGAGLHLAVLVRRYGGNELAWGVGKALNPVDDEFEVVALGYFRDAVFACKTCGVKLTCQGVSRFAGKIGRRPATRRLYVAWGRRCHAGKEHCWCVSLRKANQQGLNQQF